MFLSLRHFAPRRGSLSTVSNRALFVGLISAVAAFTACGSSPRNGSQTSNGNLIVSSNLPAGTEGSVYAGNLKASGGTSPYKFAMTSGQMPQGVNLDESSGNVSGTPTTAGTFNFGVTVSDAKGDSQQNALQIKITQASSTNPAPPSSPPPSSPPPPSNPAPRAGNSFSNVQTAGGWEQNGQGPPDYVDCSPSPCNGISFSMSQGISSPSLSGNASVFWLGGTAPYSDALFDNHLIGPFSSQGIPDPNQSLVSSLSNFTYDAYFYGDNLELSQALEFDINQYFNDMGLVFGHECRIAGGNEWDVWDNSQHKWVPTGIPCNPVSGQWNHVTIQVQRTSDNHETYQSITLNGQTANLNWTFDKGSSPGWYGLTINFQIDGDYQQDAYKVYLDNLTVTYQ